MKDQIIIATLSILLILLCTIPSVSAENATNIVILHSYHQTFIWTDNQNEGILEALKSSDTNISIFIEYLDAKNFPDSNYLELLQKAIYEKYHKKTIDILITTDDIAFQFALQHRNETFPNASIVFSGLNNIKSITPETRSYITGVVESIFPQKTIESIFMLFPKTRHVFILYENTETGHDIAKKIQESEEIYLDQAEFVYVTDMNFSDIYSWNANLPENSVIISSFTRDNEGVVLDHAKFIANLVSNNQVPVFTMYDMAMGTGAIGGSVLSGREQGYLAGTLANRIISGEPVKKISVIDTDTTVYTFDQNILSQYNILDSHLPAISIILNKKPGIIDLFFGYFVFFLTIIFILVIGVLILLENIRIRKKIEVKLRSSIDQREKAENSLRDQFRFLQELLDTIPNPVYIKEISGKYIDCNRAFEDFFKKNKNAIIGKNETDFLPVLKALELYEKDKELYENPGVQIFEATLEGKSGNSDVVFHKATYTNPEGQVLGLIGIITDISQLKKSERFLRESESRFKTLFEENPSIYFIIDEKGTIISVNPYGASHLGYEPHELIGKSFFSLYHPADTKIVEKKFSQILTSPGEVFHEEYRKLTKDGRIIHLHETIKSVPQSEHQYSIYVVNEDISERKLTEEALIQANKKLNLLNSVTFNDIQNAVFCLSGYVDLAKIESLGTQHSELIEKEITIIQAINKSLSSAKIYQNLGLKPPIWQDIHQSFLFGISHLDMSAYVRTVDVFGLEIFADPLLETVFYSLADNVIKHSNTATSITLRYNIEQDTLHLFFADNGNGILNENKERIFERGYFRKSDMGLYLVQEILAITDISIRETGIFGQGTQIEIIVQKGGYRFRELDQSGPIW